MICLRKFAVRIKYRGVSEGEQGWGAIAPSPLLGKIEGALQHYYLYYYLPPQF